MDSPISVLSKFWSTLDHYANELMHSDKIEMAKKPYGSKQAKTRLLNPEEDVRNLITTAASLEDVWQFFMKRLRNGSELDLLCFSVLDESGDFIRIKYLYPLEGALSEPIVSMAEHGNHLVHAYQRKDTTFTSHLQSLGPELQALLTRDEPTMNIFSVPLIAGDRSIAMLTLGFAEMDAFAQAKLSYVYTLRDQIAQLVWNLVLKDRMKYQAQIDSLTGLLSYSTFQRVLECELDKTDRNETSLTAMILDINNIREINEAMGHSAGDDAICHMASTVRRLIRGIDTVARYGGDDVVVILPETGCEAARVIAERFMNRFRESLPPHIQDLSISLGYATYPDDTRTRENLLKVTEQALHLAKFKGSKTGESTCIACHEIDELNDKTVIEVFASQVAKKYNNLHVPSLYQDLLAHLEKKNPGDELPSAEDLMLETITSLAGALDAKDKYTRGHSQAVANYAVALAHALQLKPEEVEHVRLAAFLHDIGKIGIPEAILCKKGPLNEKEWEIMKQHPIIGAQQILAPVTSLHPVIPAVMHHHENWDGSGHPSGLKGEGIPLGARIVSIVDAFHALTSDRSYRKALPVTEARTILEAGSGTKWDPHLVEVFIRILSIASPRTQQTREDVAIGEPEPALSQEEVVTQLSLTN